MVLINPVLTLRDPDALTSWFKNRDSSEIPDVDKIFKNGKSSVNFIHLYFTIATEIGIFHDLAPLCFAALKEAMFGGNGKCKLIVQNIHYILLRWRRKWWRRWRRRRRRRLQTIWIEFQTKFEVKWWIEKYQWKWNTCGRENRIRKYQWCSQRKVRTHQW